MSHACPQCGLEHEGSLIPAPEPEPVVVDQGPNENDVKIAEIEAEASIEREKIWTEQRGLDLESEVQELRGELRGMREVLDRVAPPEPEPPAAPVVVAPPAAPEPEPAPVPAPPADEPKTKAAARKTGIFGL